MRTRLLYIVTLTFMAAAAKAQVFFSQDFNGKTLAQVQSETPDASQFNGVGVTSAGTVYSDAIISNKFIVDRSGRPTSGAPAERVYFFRTTNLNPATQFIKVQFKFAASNINNTGNTQATFCFGESFANDGVNEDTNSWERIGISHVTGGNYRLRDGTGTGQTTADGTTYSGDGTEKTITFYLNATDGEQTYTGPDNQTHTIPAKRWNAFVGTDKQFSAQDRVPAVSDKQINNFKFFVSGGNAVYEIDDLVMEALPVATTPVSLVSFTGKNNGTGNDLQWVTSSEQNNSHFEILRSADGISFTQIGSKAGNGTTQQVNSYSFTDKTPLTGVNYYKLRQVDFDGKTEEHEVIAVDNALQNNNLKAYITSDNQLALQVGAIKSGNAIVEIRNVTGQKISDSIIQLNRGGNQFYLPLNGLEKGVYVVVVQNGDFAQRAKFIR